VGRVPWRWRWIPSRALGEADRQAILDDLRGEPGIDAAGRRSGGEGLGPLAEALRADPLDPQARAAFAERAPTVAEVRQAVEDAILGAARGDDRRAACRGGRPIGRTPLRARAAGQVPSFALDPCTETISDGIAPSMNTRGPIDPPGLSEDEALATFTRAGVAMVLSDPRLPDTPIVYVNDAFERTTGYARALVIGRNCRFLQGERTDPDHVAALREGIAEGREVTVDILNYRADGSTFRNRLLVAPVHDAGGRIRYFMSIQKELSPDEVRRSGSADEAMREIQHRVKNHLAMIVGLIRLQSRQNLGARDHFDTLARRVESLQLLYEELSFAGPARSIESISLGAYLGRICNAIAHLDGRPGIRVGIDMADLAASVETAARIGLILSEIVTNAFKHAFVDRPEGHLTVRLGPFDGRGVRIEVRDDGVGIPEGVRWPDTESMGGRIVAGLVDGLAARLLVDSGPGGTTVTLDVPDALAQG